jgi:hypothetical protein
MGARILAATLLALMLNAGQPARAAESVTPISLSCDGTIMDIVSSQSGQTQPIKIGLVLNLAEGTVSGFDFFVHIDSVDDISVSFSGETFLGGDTTLMGNINRVTGATWAHIVTWVQRDKVIKRSYDWNLTCKVINRLF